MDGLLEKVVGVTRAAGTMMLTEKDVDIGTKDTKENYVTSTDLKIEKFLRNELTALLPGSEFMGEEEDFESVSKDAYRWIVDPIDGTANYAHGIPMSVTAVALTKGGDILMGAVYQPYLDEMYCAEKGKGAFLNGRPIHVSDKPKERALVCTAWSCYNKKRAPLCFDISDRLYDVCEDIRRIGTAAYELCLVARGAAEIHYEINLAPWDYAASTCILTEAGGFAESQYGKVNLDGPGMVIAANRKETLDFVRSIIMEEVAKHPEAGINF